jgi:hypothetical protein
VVKIEYKYCPNLTIIDTPGLISAAPGRKGGSMQAASRAVEDSQTQSSGICPALPAGSAVDRQYPYIAYLAARRCPIA